MRVHLQAGLHQHPACLVDHAIELPAGEELIIGSLVFIPRIPQDGNLVLVFCPLADEVVNHQRLAKLAHAFFDNFGGNDWPL